MKVIISRTQNGAWLRIVDPGEALPELRHRDMSFEFDAYKHDGEDMSGLVRMLHEVLAAMGWDGDRHDRQRIHIDLKHGDKFEHGADDGPVDCDICKDAK